MSLLNSIIVGPPDQQTLDRAKLFKVMTQEEWDEGGGGGEVITVSSPTFITPQSMQKT